MVSRRRVLGAAALALTAGGLGQPAQAATALKVSYTATPEFGAVFIAKERGFFARRGLDVTLVSVPVAPNVPAAVMSDSVQIGGTTSSVLLQAVDSGLDLVAVAGGGSFDTTQPVAPIGLVARDGLTVRSGADLVGKKIGVPGFNAAIHVLTRKWLIDQGVDPKKVTFIEVQIPQMPDVLKGGSVDAVATAEPFVARMVQGRIGTAVTGFTQVIPNKAATVLYVSTRRWALANAATLKAFREATSEAVAFANANQAAAYDDIGKYFNVPPAVLRATPFPHFDPALTPDHLRFWVDALRQQNMLKKQTPLASVILP